MNSDQWPEVIQLVKAVKRICYFSWQWLLPFHFLMIKHKIFSTLHAYLSSFNFCTFNNFLFIFSTLKCIKCHYRSTLTAEIFYQFLFCRMLILNYNEANVIRLKRRTTFCSVFSTEKASIRLFPQRHIQVSLWYYRGIISWIFIYSQLFCLQGSRAISHFLFVMFTVLLSSIFKITCL